jgi:Asp-tRNA(Asn)/Glu-tRNA(Gln) amidotransferase A subunit family amidase
MLTEAVGSRTDASPAIARTGQVLRCLVSAERGEERDGPLAEMTYLAKDLLDLPGRAPSLGLAANDDAPPSRKAAVLDRLDSAGALRLGFAEMTALACEPSGSNPGRQRPLNPWDPDRICGGSSSGSAVAVAAGLVDVAIGSDTAGSLRIPAHCCGVSAWKPSFGLVPTEGTMALAPSLDVLGFMARDAVPLLRVAELFCDRTSGPVRRTVAVAEDLIAHSDPAIAAACSTLAAICERLGHRLASAPLAPLIGDCDAAVLDLLLFETSARHGWRLGDGTLDTTLETRLRKGLAIAPERAAEARGRLRAVAEASTLFRSHDVWLLPVMAQPTPQVTSCEPGSPHFSARTLYGLSALTRFANGLGLPAVALPCGFDDNGMPIAAQLVGRPGSDMMLLALAVEIQSCTAWHGREPTALAALLEDAR